MDQETTNELWCSQRHGGVAASTFKTVIFDAKGYVIGIGSDQAAVGNRDPMGIARQISEHRLWSREGFFCVVSKTRLWHDDDPVDFAERLQESIKGVTINKFSKIAKEVQLSGCMQLGQTLQNQASI